MKGFGGGFRQEWIKVELPNGRGNVELQSGAGLGNPLLTFSHERAGKTRFWTADLRPLIRDLVDRLELQS